MQDSKRGNYKKWKEVKWQMGNYTSFHWTTIRTTFPESQYFASKDDDWIDSFHLKSNCGDAGSSVAI